MVDHLDCDESALAQGLTILERLTYVGSATAEQLADSIGLGEAAVLRLLRVLEAAGTVAADPDATRWHANVRFDADADPGFRERSTRVLVELSERCGQACECYRFEHGRMVMIDRADPEQRDVAVLARIGYVRRIVELEAVAQLVLAFGTDAAETVQHHRYVAGRWCPVAREQEQVVIARVRRDRVACDLSANKVGIRRFAAPIVGVDGSLIGAVTIAHDHPPAPGSGDRPFLAMVRVAAERLSAAPAAGDA